MEKEVKIVVILGGMGECSDWEGAEGGASGVLVIFYFLTQVIVIQ